MLTPSSASSKDIAEMLLEEGLITPRQLEKAIEQQTGPCNGRPSECICH